MEGCLTHLGPYPSKTQTKWTGTIYKCVFEVVINDKLEQGWSLQLNPKMRNYKNWKDMADNKLLAPSKWIMMGNLKIRSRSAKTLEADYFVDEDRPKIIDIIDKPKKKIHQTSKPSKTPKTPKTSKTPNQFNNLFEKCPKEATTISLTTSIKSLPTVIVHTIGMDPTKIVYIYYNPTCGWEIAVEEQQKTHIIICKEKEKIVKCYS